MEQVQQYPFTFFFLLLFAGISIQAFSHPEWKQKLIFSPYRIKRTDEWYRFLTSGFIHADWMHLLFNGYVFYQFSRIIEAYLGYKYGFWLGGILTGLLFLTGVIVSHITSYKKNVENPWYASLGASGGVSSILYAFIFLFPFQNLRILFIPFDIPAILIGIVYLLVSNYYAHRGSNDNVNHEAHYIGSLWGIVFMVILDVNNLYVFVAQVLEWFRSVGLF